MNTANDFIPVPPDASCAVTWIHLGDLHMVRSGEQNYKDLQAIVDESTPSKPAKGVNFVFFPGDMADDGSERAYGGYASASIAFSCSGVPSWAITMCLRRASQTSRAS